MKTVNCRIFLKLTIVILAVLPLLSTRQNKPFKVTTISSFTSTAVTSATISTAYTYALTTNANTANVVTTTTLPSWLTLEQVGPLAGSGTAGFTNNTGSAAQFSTPNGVAVNALGNVYVVGYSNNCIRKITLSGEASTLAKNSPLSLMEGIL